MRQECTFPSARRDKLHHGADAYHRGGKVCKVPVHYSPWSQVKLSINVMASVQFMLKTWCNKNKFRLCTNFLYIITNVVSFCKLSYLLTHSIGTNAFFAQSRICCCCFVDICSLLFGISAKCTVENEI